MPRWTDKLARPVRDKAGSTIVTRAQARDYILALPDRRQQRQSWQHATKLLLEGADAETVTKQIEYALMLDGALVFPSRGEP
jgi:hypothetical protein